MPAPDIRTLAARVGDADVDLDISTVLGEVVVYDTAGAIELIIQCLGGVGTLACDGEMEDSERVPDFILTTTCRLHTMSYRHAEVLRANFQRLADWSRERPIVRIVAAPDRWLTVYHADGREAYLPHLQ